MNSRTYLILFVISDMIILLSILKLFPIMINRLMLFFSLWFTFIFINKFEERKRIEKNEN